MPKLMCCFFNSNMLFPYLPLYPFLSPFPLSPSFSFFLPLSFTFEPCLSQAYASAVQRSCSFTHGEVQLQLLHSFAHLVAVWKDHVKASVAMPSQPQPRGASQATLDLFRAQCRSSAGGPHSTLATLFDYMSSEVTTLLFMATSHSQGSRV